MMDDISSWLLDGSSWVKYAAELQLLEIKPDINLLLQDRAITNIIDRIKGNKVGIPALKTMKIAYTSAGNAYWDLFFLADIGLSRNEIDLDREVEEFFNLQLPDGSFITQAGMKPGFLCIPTIILSSLVKMGYGDDPRVKKSLELILRSQRLDGGWHCAKTRAVGQKLQNSESCPMDNLNTLMLLGQFEEFRTDPRFNGAIDLLLLHWNRRGEAWRPYGFGIGSQFKKLKYPAVKYGILRVLDVLSLFPHALRHKEFNNMLGFAKDKSVEGKYFAESISRSYPEFDFGQTKEPSRWVTFLINRIEKRMNDFEQVKQK